MTDSTLQRSMISDGSPQGVRSVSHTAAAVHCGGCCYDNERVGRGLIVLITRAHTAERLTDYPAAHKGQPQSLPVQIILCVH